MNVVILKGNLGKDPEEKKGNNFNLVNFSLATTNFKKETVWHNCTAWSKTAEAIAKHFRKGQQILVRGEIQYHEKDGKRYTTINVSEFDFCGHQPNKEQEAKASKQPNETSDLPF